MINWSSSRMCRNVVMIIAAIIVESTCMKSMTPAAIDGPKIAASARGDTGQLILAQYNPCPNRMCR
jgi:hypothetical protein